MAVVVPPLRGRSAGRSFDNVEYWLDEVDKYAGPHVQKVRAPNSDTRLCLCLCLCLCACACFRSLRLCLCLSVPCCR